MANASEVLVGKQKAEIADSVAIYKVYGETRVIKVYYFSKKLNNEQRAKIEKSDYDQIFKESGVYPVLDLVLFFKNGAQICSADELESYYVAFESNEDFDFTSYRGTVMRSFERTKNKPISSIGFANLKCSFNDGEELAFELKGDSRKAHSGLGGKEETLFKWSFNKPFKWNLKTSEKLVVIKESY